MVCDGGMEVVVSRAPHQRTDLRALPPVPLAADGRPVVVGPSTSCAALARIRRVLETADDGSRGNSAAGIMQNVPGGADLRSSHYPRFVVTTGASGNDMARNIPGQHVQNVYTAFPVRKVEKRAAGTAQMDQLGGADLETDSEGSLLDFSQLPLEAFTISGADLQASQRPFESHPQHHHHHHHHRRPHTARQQSPLQLQLHPPTSGFVPQTDLSKAHAGSGQRHPRLPTLAVPAGSFSPQLPHVQFMRCALPRSHSASSAEVLLSSPQSSFSSLSSSNSSFSSSSSSSSSTSSASLDRQQLCVRRGVAVASCQSHVLVGSGVEIRSTPCSPTSPPLDSSSMTPSAALAPRGCGYLEGLSAARLYLYARLPTVSSSTDLERLGQTLYGLEEGKFYYPDLDSNAARALLQDSPEGTFLVRDSSDPKYLYSLSVKTARGATSVRVEYFRGYFQLDCEDAMKRKLPRFEKLPQLLDFHSAVSRDSDGGQYRWLESSRRKDMVMRLTTPRRHSPPSLTHLARLAVNQQLADLHLPSRSTDRLPLPDAIKNYLRAYPYKL